LNFEGFKNLKAVQYKCTIVINQAPNNEYDAKKNYYELIRMVYDRSQSIFYLEDDLLFTP